MRRLPRVICSIVCFAALVPAARAADAPTAFSYQQLVDQYLAGDWKALETSLAQHARDIAGFLPDQAADVAYIRQVMAECHPAWWEETRAGKKVAIEPTVWGRTLHLIYDPSIPNNVFMQSLSNGQQLLSVNWPAPEMENPAPAEHGFSKGDLASLGDWGVIGVADIWSQSTQSRINGLVRQPRFQRYQGFRGTLTGIYYGTPRARAWGCFLSLDAFGDHYANVADFIARKPVGAMLLAEIAKSPERYPTLRLTTRLPEAKVEQRLAASLMNQFARRITLGEDKALREAIKAFAQANTDGALTSGKVVLPNTLTMAADPGQDALLAKKRDAWLREQVAPDSAPATLPGTTRRFLQQ